MPATFSVSRALVTGAGRGIGAGIARRLASEGLTVTVMDIDGDLAAQTAAEISSGDGPRAYGLQCDVRDRSAVARAVTEAATSMGGLDTLVTSAGITRDAFAHKMTDEAWDDVIAVHLTGTFACFRSAAPFLKEAGTGRVVTVSSISAAMGNLGQANYTAAKGGIISLTKTLAHETARNGTTVNCVRPGFIDTDMTAVLDPAVRARLLEGIPVRRSGTVDEVAGAVAFLCSDDAAFITGSVLDVNGGDYM